MWQNTAGHILHWRSLQQQSASHFKTGRILDFSHSSIMSHAVYSRVEELTAADAPRCACIKIMV